MSQQLIGIGLTANDGTGDDLRDAFDKINDNFTELYTELGGTSLSNITINGNTISSDNSNGDINVDPNGTGDVVITSGNLLPASDSAIQDIGSAADQWTNLYVGQATIGTASISNLSGNLLPADDSGVQSIGSSSAEWSNVYAGQIHTSIFTFNGNTQTSVGSAGGASALPATPTGYIEVDVAGTIYVMPYYAAS